MAFVGKCTYIFIFITANLRKNKARYIIKPLKVSKQTDTAFRENCLHRFTLPTLTLTVKRNRAVIINTKFSLKVSNSGLESRRNMDI